MMHISSIWAQLKPHLWGIDTGYDVTGNCITENDVTGYDGSREPETGNEREIISRVCPVFLGTNNGNKLSCAPILLIFFSLIIRLVFVFVIFFLELSLIIRIVFVFVIFFLELSLIIRIVFVFVIFFLELSLIIRFVFVFVIFFLELSLIIRIVFVFVIFFLELSLIIRFVFVIFCLELSIYDDVS